MGMVRHRTQWVLTPINNHGRSASIGRRPGRFAFPRLKTTAGVAHTASSPNRAGFLSSITSVGMPWLACWRLRGPPRRRSPLARARAWPFRRLGRPRGFLPPSACRSWPILALGGRGGPVGRGVFVDGTIEMPTTSQQPRRIFSRRHESSSRGAAGNDVCRLGYGPLGTHWPEDRETEE
jgi:hypothetical protein